MNDDTRSSQNGPYEFELLIPVVVLAFVVIIDVVGVASVIAGTPELILVVPGLFAAGGFVWLIVRRVNGRDDPRNANNPASPLDSD
jgi:hypothetical protein